MQANRLDSYPYTSFLTLLISLQCSNNDFGGGNVSKDVLYGPGGRINLLRVVFSR